MPTIPLYETLSNPDAWHRVVAPGGYEWWSFEANDEATRLCLKLDVLDGDVFDRAYFGAYKRYRRRPTRATPPVPRDYPAVRGRLVRGTETLWSTYVPLPPGSFDGSTTSPDLRLGPVSVQVAADGALRLFAKDLAGVDGARVSVDLTFRPRDVRPSAMEELAPGESAVHFNIVRTAAGLYDAAGEVRLSRAVGGIGTSNTFHGEGRHRHRFGTGPMDKRYRSYDEIATHGNGG